MTPAEAKRGALVRSAAILVALAGAGGALALSPKVAELAEARAKMATGAALVAPQPALAEPLSATRLAALMTPEPDSPQAFLPNRRRDATAICDALTAAGFANSGWSRSGVAGGRWECFAAPGEAGPGAAFSVFYMLRGDARRVDEMRLKVSLHDAASASSLRAKVTGFLGAFAASAHIAFPPAFLAAVRAGEWATFVSPYATYTFARETGAVNRWNLGIAFAGPEENIDGALSLPVRAVLGKRQNRVAAPVTLIAEH